MAEPRQHVKVHVPATAANMGAGFDCMGIALDLWNTVEAEVNDKTVILIEGEGKDELPRYEANLIYRSCAHFFERTGRTVPKLRITCYNAIPLKRGLGSSAAAIAGGLSTANLLTGAPLNRQLLLNLALEIEPYPDNVAPTIHGGCVIVLNDGKNWFTRPIPLPSELRAVVFIPRAEIATDYARAILPKVVPRKDAIFNLGRAALMVNALMSGRLEDLRVATQDMLHQPARSKLWPPMMPVIEAAMEAGALGAFLAGAGPTILALVNDRDEAIADAMLQTARRMNAQGETRVLQPTFQGLHEVAP
jgi:homoserine kinase